MTVIAPDPEVPPASGVYTQEDWDEVCDSPELTDEQLAGLRPAAELPPEVHAALPRRKGGRPESPTTKVPVTIRLDRDTLDRFRASGPDWQSRVNAILRAAKV